MSPRIFDLMTERGAFSVIDAYVGLAAQGERIVGFRADEYYWQDAGTLESRAQAESDARLKP
jgi:NDP-sugar pyrophosphorylase family protein